MLKHLMNHWKTHRQSSPYVVSDDPFYCTDLSSGSSWDKNIYSVNRVNPIYQNSENSDLEECSSERDCENCQANFDLKDVYKPRCSTCGSYPPTISYGITRTFGDTYAPPSLLSSEISLPSMEKKASDVDGFDVSLKPPLNRCLTTNAKLANKITPFLYGGQIKKAYEDFRTKKARNSFVSRGPVSSETEDSGIQIGNSCASSLENEETDAICYSLHSPDKKDISLVEPVICLNHNHLPVSKRVAKDHERNLSFFKPCVGRVTEQQANSSSSNKSKEPPDSFNKIHESESVEEQMKTNEDSKEDTENVSDFDESLKSEAAFTAKNKDLNGSQQILNDVTFEKSTSRTKETSGLKTQKNNIINSDSQPEFTSCNSELPHNSSVKGPKFPFSTRTSSHACDQDEIDRLKQIQNITTSNRLVLAKDLSPLKREDNRGSRTSEKTVSILKPVSNNSSSSDCVSECPVCRQSPQDQKHLFRKFASEDKGTKKREMIHQNTANSGMYDWNTNQGTFQNPEREAPTKRIQLNDTAVSLCGQCGFNKKGRVSKQCEEYYNSLQEAKSRQRPRVSGGCTYCQKQRNQDLHAEHKTKNISCNGCGVGNCKHLSNMNTRVNSVRSSCKNQGYNSGGSSVGFIRDIDRDIVHDSYPSSGTFQYRYPYMDSWNSKQGVEPEIHRYANDSRGTIKSENQWSFPISQCTCNHHIGHYGHRRHITFAEDLEPQEGQCSEKLNPIFQKSGVGFEPTEHIMDPEPVFLSPSRLHADYVRGVKHKKSLPEADDFLAYRKRQPDSQTQHINNPFQLSQTQDYYRHYPWPNVQNWENFLYKQRLRKRKKRAMYMGVIAIGIIVVVGIAVAMVLAVLRRKHSNVA